MYLEISGSSIARTWNKKEGKEARMIPRFLVGSKWIWDLIRENWSGGE